MMKKLIQLFYQVYGTINNGFKEISVLGCSPRMAGDCPEQPQVKT